MMSTAPSCLYWRLADGWLAWWKLYHNSSSGSSNTHRTLESLENQNWLSGHLEQIKGSALLLPYWSSQRRQPGSLCLYPVAHIFSIPMTWPVMVTSRLLPPGQANGFGHRYRVGSIMSAILPSRTLADLFVAIMPSGTASEAPPKHSTKGPPTSAPSVLHISQCSTIEGCSVVWGTLRGCIEPSVPAGQAPHVLKFTSKGFQS